MRPIKYMQHVLIGATAILSVSATTVRAQDELAQNVTVATAEFAGNEFSTTSSTVTKSSGKVADEVKEALDAIRPAVAKLSHPKALETAFNSYFAYKAANPNEVRKPLLYFVDYGLSATTPRGYIFDMDSRKVVEGPFTVAHGRGSAGANGIPTRFSNTSGSAATSLGLYVAKNTYAFSGKSGGRGYRSIGLRMKGVSRGFNDNAMARGVVAHGAPYVTATRAGRSEGCPAMEEARAQRLLPKLANGGMVFLFAPDANWMARDQWIAADAG